MARQVHHRLHKADDADVYLFQQQTYAESPNYFVAGAALSDAQAVSHTNAFQGDYAWGKQVLMDYTNKRGDKLQMMLTYPADYQPGKKYPMVVYYYEKLSQGFHQYVVPSDRSTVQHVGVQPERLLRAPARHPVPGDGTRATPDSTASCPR